MPIDATAAALIGAAIGALGSVGGVWLAQRHQTRRELLNAAVKLGTDEHRGDVEQAGKMKGTVLVPPPYAYVAFNAEILHAIASKQLTPERLKKIQEEHDAVTAVIGRPE